MSLRLTLTSGLRGTTLFMTARHPGRAVGHAQKLFAVGEGVAVPVAAERRVEATPGRPVMELLLSARETITETSTTFQSLSVVGNSQSVAVCCGADAGPALATHTCRGQEEVRPE